MVARFYGWETSMSDWALGLQKVGSTDIQDKEINRISKLYDMSKGISLK